MADEAVCKGWADKMVPTLCSPLEEARGEGADGLSLLGGPGLGGRGAGREAEEARAGEAPPPEALYRCFSAMGFGEGEPASEALLRGLGGLPDDVSEM